MTLAETQSNDVARFQLKAMGLRTGMALQTRRLAEGASKKESQFFAAIEGKGVMLGPIGPDGAKTELETGEVCVVRGFTGQYEFSFLSKVLQTFDTPFAYALLAYPAQVDARLVRQSMRTKTSWPTTILLPQNAQTADAPSIEVVLVDLSTAGAMVKAPSALAAIGEKITLQMAIHINGAATYLSLVCRVCHNNKATSEATFFVGLAFETLTPHDKLVLHYLTQAPPTSV